MATHPDLLRPLSQSLLSACRRGGTAEQVSKSSGIALKTVRMGITRLVFLGALSVKGGTYTTTPTGTAALAR